MARMKEQELNEWQASQIEETASAFDFLVKNNWVVRERLEGFKNVDDAKKMLLDSLNEGWNRSGTQVVETEWTPDEATLDELAEFMLAEVLGQVRLPELHQPDNARKPVTTYSLEFSGGQMQVPYKSDVVIWGKQGGESGNALLLLARKQGGLHQPSNTLK